MRLFPDNIGKPNVTDAGDDAPREPCEKCADAIDERGRATRESRLKSRRAGCDGGDIGTHLQMGIGDGLVPDNLNCSIYEDICIVKDDEALETSRRLAKEEGILCGISSGSNVAAALKLAKILGKGKRVVTILPDTGERYFSTPLFTQN